MIAHDKDKRLIIWGYKESETQVLAPLCYVAPNFFQYTVQLENKVVIQIPEQYLGSTYPIAINNIRFKKVLTT